MVEPIEIDGSCHTRCKKRCTAQHYLVGVRNYGYWVKDWPTCGPK